MLSGISIVCFSASYAVALALELSRLWFRMPVRFFLLLGCTAAGLLAQTLYLVHRAEAGEMPLSSWYDWFLIAAWVLAAAYLLLAVSRPQINVGLFFLPVVLITIGVAYLFRDQAAFPRDRALATWGLAHGLMLLIGTVAVLLGFVAGVMYLVQSAQLKRHAMPQSRLKLPSLEWLQSINKYTLSYSCFFVALGLIAGIVLNSIEGGGRGQALPWTDSAVIASGLLLLWLIAATIFEWAYKPAQQGRKVAYLTVASFVFLAIVMAMLIAGGSKHAKPGLSADQIQNSEFRIQNSRISAFCILHSAFALPSRLPSSVEAAL
jgi:hypothetical protein